MRTDPQINENTPTRQTKLRVFCIEHEVSLTGIAGKLGISKQALSNALRGESCPPEILSKVKALNVIPDHLLPEPTRSKGELLRELSTLRAEVRQLKSAQAA